jgi:hypothetical protein
VPFIILIKLIKLVFSNLAALTFGQQHICVMILGHLQINFVATSVLLVFLKRFIKDFFLSTYAKKMHFLWHRTLNQHIHIDTMYPFGITHFNTMIIIPLCENCKLCTYWYHLVWVFIFLPQYPYYHGIQIFQKNQIFIPNGYVKSSIPIQHWK